MQYTFHGFVQKKNIQKFHLVKIVDDEYFLL